MYTVVVWSLYIGLIYSYGAHSRVFPLFDWNTILESIQNGESSSLGVVKADSILSTLGLLTQNLRNLNFGEEKQRIKISHASDFLVLWIMYSGLGEHSYLKALPFCSCPAGSAVRISYHFHGSDVRDSGRMLAKEQHVQFQTLREMSGKASPLELCPKAFPSCTLCLIISQILFCLLTCFLRPT